jgi:hypothetical protein
MPHCHAQIARATFHANVRITEVAGWAESGIVARTIESDASGLVEVISPRHLYNYELGRDLYPTVEQVVQLKAGETVVLGVKQWA